MSLPAVRHLAAATPDQFVREYAWLARTLAAKVFLPGSDADDVEQVAMIGLLDAARSYDPARGVPFTGFAVLVIRRYLADAITTANRGKHKPLNESARVVRLPNGAEADVIDLIPATHTPDELVGQRDQLRSLVDGIKGLTPLERDSLVRVAFCGETYGGGYRKDKRVDNALRRARLKLREAA